MKHSLIFRMVISFSLLFFFTYFCLAQFETTIGLLNGSDETSDIKSLPNGNTIVLATTTSFGTDKILLVELNPAGTVISFKIIQGADPSVKFVGTNLALDFDATGNHTGYFITGCKGNYPTQMILIHTDKFGTPDWSRQMDNGLAPNATSLSECGISLESQSNRDIIVVGRTNAGGDFQSRFSVSRFSSFGVLIWSNRYSSPHDQYIPNESCNGLRGKQEVVTVVGHIHDELGIGHTYLSCIRASNGSEFWREQYNSRHEHDDGTDLVQNPSDQGYMVVGHAENYSPPLGGPTRMWVFNVTGKAGAFTGGATYYIPTKNNLFARDVCLSTDNIAGTITGFLDYATTSGSFETKTFIMKLPFVPAALPLFSHYFTNSDPLNFLFADDAIELTQGVNPGYVLGTQAKLTGAASIDYDIHALRLDQFGMHNKTTNCPIVQIVPKLEREGKSINLKKKSTKSAWRNTEVVSTIGDYIEEPCIGPAVVNQNIVSRSLSFTDSKLYPNPAIAGSVINIQVELEYSSPLEIQLVDMTGKLYSQFHEFRNKGSQLVSFRLPETLATNVYMVEVKQENGRSLVFKLLIH